MLRRLLYILSFLPGIIYAQHHHSCPVAHYTDDVYKNPLYENYLSKYDVSFYHLSLEVSNDSTYIEGFTTIEAGATAKIDTVVFQIINALKIDSIILNGSRVNQFHHVNDAVFIPGNFFSGDRFLVTVYYRGDAGQDRGFFAGLTSAWDNNNGQWVTYTLSEPLNARDWFAVKQVLSDKADSVYVDLTVDRDLMAGSIGTLEDIENIEEHKHIFKWRSRYPIAYYLISLAVADYRDYSFNAPLSMPGDSVLIQNYIYDDDQYFDNWKDNIDRTSDMMELFSKLVEDYPFKNEKYGHAVAPMGGGMEHQTMTTIANFNFTLVAHELAHQWFGNNVTCGNWQDIWINEGFASYFEYLALQYLVSQEAADSWMEGSKRFAYEAEGSVYVPKEEAEDVYRVFNYGLSYKKGAALLHMIRYEINDDSVFFQVLREYSELYSDSLAIANDFLEVLIDVSGLDFSCFFDQWYYGKGYPTFKILWYASNDTLHIRSLQETVNPETSLFEMSFDLAVKTDNGEEIIRLYQDQNEQIFSIPFTEFIWDISFDPHKHLLAKSSVEMKLPDDEDIVLGPNPSGRMLNVKMKGATGNEKYELIDIKGKPVMSGQLETSPSRIDLASLSSGSYILIIKGDSFTYKEKIVKLDD